ncbi:MAG TPA: hypothetical protein VFT45_03740 [Longimicrobium sp.]|nr:hypothetical protein [Longimicrobium sp.]
MKKLSLNVDALKVETFDTVRTGSARGTVAAHNNTLDTCPGPDSLDGPTCMGNPEWTCRYHCTFYPGTTCE